MGGARKQFKRGAAVDSSPVQHSLRKQPRGRTAQARGDGRRRPLVTLRNCETARDTRL